MEHDNELRFSAAMGLGAALAGMNDSRAYYTFDGDLNQMGQIYAFLLGRGYPVVKSNVYPGFPRDAEETYKRALREVYQSRVEGWWSQRRQLLEYGICTEAEFVAALDVQCAISRAERGPRESN
jgi:hypothetical protein